MNDFHTSARKTISIIRSIDSVHAAKDVKIPTLFPHKIILIFYISYRPADEASVCAILRGFSGSIRWVCS